MPIKKREIPWLGQRNGVYTVFWYDAGTRQTGRQSLYTKDSEEAQVRYAAFLAEGKDIIAKRSAGLTVSDALDSYFIEHIKKNACEPKSTQTSISHLQTHFGDTPLKDVGPSDCIAYLNARLTGTIGQIAKESTVGKELGVLRAAAKYAVKWKRISLAEMPTFEIPRGPVSKGIWLFKDELQRLFDTARNLDNYGEMEQKALSYLELLYYTGSRRRAIEQLTWQQVDLFRRRVNLSKAGEKQTKKRRPTIPIDPLLMPTFLRCQQHRENDYVLGGSGAILINMFNRCAKAAGVFDLPERDGRPQAKLSPHMLRHSRATHLLEEGKSMWAVAALLGDTVQTVAAVYGHHSADFLEKQLYGEPPAKESPLKLIEVIG